MLHHVQTDCAGVTEVIDLKTGRLSWIPLWVPSNHASHEKQRTLSGWRQKRCGRRGGQTYLKRKRTRRTFAGLKMKTQVRNTRNFKQLGKALRCQPARNGTAALQCKQVNSVTIEWPWQQMCPPEPRLADTMTLACEAWSRGTAQPTGISDLQKCEIINLLSFWQFVTAAVENKYTRWLNYFLT